MWGEGDWIVRREIWRSRPWLGTTVRVVIDRDDLLASYLPSGTPFGFPDGDWPGGEHPWKGRGAWQGHGVLMAGRRWWDDRWRDFEPDPAWVVPGLPHGWDAIVPRA